MIEYLVISRGGVWGFGSKLCSIPWKAANARIHENALILGLCKDRFESAPTVDKWIKTMRTEGIYKFLIAFLTINAVAFWKVEANGAAQEKLPQQPQLVLQECVTAERAIKPNPFSKFSEVQRKRERIFG